MMVRELIANSVPVALGGAAGAVARMVLTAACVHWLGAGFAWGTLLVNVLGSCLLGFIVQAAYSTEWLSPFYYLALTTGFLGAFTTFSTFSVQTLQAWQQSPVAGAANLAANLALGLAAAVVGMTLAAKCVAVAGA